MSKQGNTRAGRASTTFTAEERSAMKDRAREARSGADGDGESEVLAKIAGMNDRDRGMAERIHAIIKSVAPSMTPRLWYGQPAYSKDGDTICFFQPSQKFRTRFATLGFSDKARLDDTAMWPTYYALMEMNPEVEARIAELVKRAIG